MLEPVEQPKGDWLSLFNDYLQSRNNLSDGDRSILERLKNFMTEDEVNKYSSAINNYFFYDNKLEINTDLLPSDRVPVFWRRYKGFLENIIQPLEHCPVCGISYNQEFNIKKSIEHVLPKSKYQQYILLPNNLVYFCEYCNRCHGNIVESRVFHPYFSEIDCHSNIKVSFLERRKTKLNVEVTDSNDDIMYFINDLFKLYKNYKQYIDKIINKEISSIELVLGNKLSHQLREEQLNILTNFIIHSYDFESNSYYFKTETEKEIAEKIAEEIDRNPRLYASYILDRMTLI